MQMNLPEILSRFTTVEIEKLKMFLSLMPDIAKRETSTDERELITLKLFLKEYADYIKSNRSSAYHTSVLNSFKHLLDFFAPQTPITSIGLRDVESFVAYLQQKVPKGFRVYVKNLKAGFNKGVDWKYINQNHFLKIKLPKKQKVNPCYINAEQLELICGHIPNEIIKEMVTIAFYSGLRREELVSLTWRNVNLIEKVITVGDDVFTTKGKNQRYVPIADEVFQILSIKAATRKIIKLKDDYIFTKPDGQHLSGDHLSKEFKKACAAAGLDPGIHYHSLRHSFASFLVQSGTSLYIVKELLGHASVATTEIYSHLNLDALKTAISKFDGIEIR